MKIAITSIIRLAFLTAWASAVFGSPVFSMTVENQQSGLTATHFCTAENIKPQIELPMPQFAVIREFTLQKPVTAIAWSPSGHVIATSENLDNVIKIWNVETGQLLHEVHKLFKGSDQLLFTKNGQYLLTSFAGNFDGRDRGAISVINVDTGQIEKTLNGSNDPTNFAMANLPSNFALSPDGRLLYVSFHKGDQIDYYDTTDWNIVGSFHSDASVISGGPGPDQLTGVEIEPATNIRPGPSSNGNPTMIADHHTFLKVWSPKQEVPVREFELESPIYPNSVVVDAPACSAIIGEFGSPNGDKVQVGIWDLNSSQRLSVMSGVAPIRSLSLDPTRRFLAIVESDMTVYVVEISRLDKPILLHRFGGYSWRAQFSLDGRKIMIAGDNKVIIYELM